MGHHSQRKAGRELAPLRRLERKEIPKYGIPYLDHPAYRELQQTLADRGLLITEVPARFWFSLEENVRALRELCGITNEELSKKFLGKESVSKGEQVKVAGLLTNRGQKVLAYFHAAAVMGFDPRVILIEDLRVALAGLLRENTQLLIAFPNILVSLPKVERLICPKCKAETEEIQARFCPHCGKARPIPKW